VFADRQNGFEQTQAIFMRTRRNHHERTGFLRVIAVNVFVFVFLLIIIEGSASYVLLVRDVMTTKTLAERRHTKYDPDLGWVNEPNAYIPDIYGPGIYFRTNAQGFRNDHDISPIVAGAKTRVVCSGDSFTLGYGVDNAHTWCELLSVLDPQLETVNMGQGGYGVDQAYLWYKRDGAKFQHQVQLFAFITDDFYRTLRDSFESYPKPVLEVQNDALVVKKVPVPRRHYYFPWLTASVENLRNLRTVEFLTRLLRKSSFVTARSVSQRERDDQVHNILKKIFEDLKRLNRQRGSKLILVYLPTMDELQGNGLRHQWTPAEQWTEFLENEAGSLHIPIINMFKEFRSLSDTTMVHLFIQKGDLPYPSAEGHLNNQGNEFVAKVVHEKLSAML
jgi:hypothetical protein